MNQHLKSDTIAFIGGGMMGGAIINALVEKELLPKEQIIVSEINPKRRAFLQKKYSEITIVNNNVEACRAADIVVLAVKPQMLPKVMVEIFGTFKKNSVIMSIVAGVPMSAIQSGVGHNIVVRTMPNTPAQIGEGMTVWTATGEVGPEKRAGIQAVLQAMGLEIYVTNENALDMATAVCGTGPTYAFLLMEALLDAAVHMGLSRADARPLVIQTVLGSAKFAMQSDKHLAELRNMVTSPGGTSAEAVYQMEKGGMRTILSKAVWAAYKKARLLGKRAESLPAAPLHIDNDY